MTDTGPRQQEKNSKARRNRQRNQSNPATKLSRGLSWALRHAAPDIGLTMTPDGYVPVREILESKHLKLRGCTLEIMQELVSNNDKQRFKLEKRPKHLYFPDSDAGDTILCIRANQGHSIKTIDPAQLLYRIPNEELAQIPCIVHGTYAAPWEKIKEQGLKKMNRTHIHFAAGLPNEGGVISGMRKSCTVCIYINPKKCADDGIAFYRSDNGVLLSDGVDGVLSPKYFAKVSNR